MNKGLASIILFIFCCFGYIQAQNYPQYDRQPMDISPDISGGFCVMRAHHFHLGLDFRTQREIGKSIYAIADGYVKRLKISHYGYGWLIQIQHPDGYVSHYGHLSKYAAPIDEYVKKLQYSLKSYEFEYFPKPGEIPVKKGQVIAYSGNTGGSQGPHLHFEIRDSTNTYVFNPLLFGIKISDTKAPKLKGLRFYSQGKAATNYDMKVNKYGTMYMSSSTLYATNWWGLAYKAVDPQNGSGFNNSVYHTQLFVDGELAFEFKLDKMKIDDQRSSDYHMDYSYWVDHTEYYEKLFLEEGNASVLDIYTKGLKDVTNSLTAGNHQVKLRLADYNKNRTEFSFTLNFTTVTTDAYFDVNLVKFDKAYTVATSAGELSIMMVPNTLYESLEKLEPIITSRQNEYGELSFSFGTKYIPVRYPYKVDIKVNHSKIPVNKLCVVYYGKEGKMKYYSPTSYNENSISVEVKDMGSFSVWADTTRPVISKISVKDSMYIMHNGKIITTATDNLSDISKYNAYLDGEWLLTEYEYKEDLLSTALPVGLTDGPHVFEIEVMDDLLNKTYRKMTIFITHNVDDLLKNKKRK